jgi:hypothetical protein
MKLALCCAIVLASFTAAFGQAAPPHATSLSDGVLTIVGMPADARSLVSEKEVVVLYANKFRYDLGAQTTQAPIGAATPPGALALSASQIAKLPSDIVQSPAQPVAPAAGGNNLGAKGMVAPQPPPPPPPPHIPDYPQACDQSDKVDPWPSSATDQVKRITVCWLGIRNSVETDQTHLLTLRGQINTVIHNAATEQACYVQALRNFGEPLLALNQAVKLIELATANATAGDKHGCYQDADDWPRDSAEKLVMDLSKLQRDLSDLETAQGYTTWASPAFKSANSALVAQIASFITEATFYQTGTPSQGLDSNIAKTYNDFQSVVENNKLWRVRLSNLLNNPPSETFKLGSLSSLEVDIAIDSCHLWYGKGRIDTIKLHAVDLSSSTGVSQDIPLATNTCNPRTIASTGIGVSFLASPTFSFVAGDNTGTQVIGETATNSATPLYAALYNVQLVNFKHGMEFFASPGVGLTSSSATTNTDFLGGVSISLARRVLFVTPSADFGRRDRLAPGFKIGDPKGSLTSVPTQSHWPVGFMISISFGIGPS